MRGLRLRCLFAHGFVAMFYPDFTRYSWMVTIQGNGNGHVFFTSKLMFCLAKEKNYKLLLCITNGYFLKTGD